MSRVYTEDEIEDIIGAANEAAHDAATEQYEELLQESHDKMTETIGQLLSIFDKNFAEVQRVLKNHMKED